MLCFPDLQYIAVPRQTTEDEICRKRIKKDENKKRIPFKILLHRTKGLSCETNKLTVNNKIIGHLIFYKTINLNPYSGSGEGILLIS